MNEIERRILENQEVMLDALFALTIKCDVSGNEIRGDMKRKMALAEASVKTKELLRSEEGERVSRDKT